MSFDLVNYLVKPIQDSKNSSLGSLINLSTSCNGTENMRRLWRWRCVHSRIETSFLMTTGALVTRERQLTTGHRVSTPAGPASQASFTPFSGWWSQLFASVNTILSRKPASTSFSWSEAEHWLSPQRTRPLVRSATSACHWDSGASQETSVKRQNLHANVPRSQRQLFSLCAGARCHCCK